MQTISFRSSQQCEWTIIRCSFQGKFLQESTQDCSILSLLVEIHFRRLRCLFFGTGNQNPHVSAKAEHGARTKGTDSILNLLRHFCLVDEHYDVNASFETNDVIKKFSPRAFYAAKCSDDNLRNLPCVALQNMANLLKKP